MNEIVTRIKAKAIAVKDWALEHGEVIMYGATSLLLLGGVVYLKGYMSGIKYGRAEWDFGNDEGEWAVIMEDNGEFRAALPMRALAEVMENHRVKEWTSDMWTKRD